ncbi:MAG: hypothetical protein JSW46_13515 [Gemmatimonadota bacterium]|nr:MAG: hypothetical protein JSW46_13515 [Gemmatimonadota bacterium]
MNDDPAVKEGAMRAELYPYQIAFMRGAYSAPAAVSGVATYRETGGHDVVSARS